MGARSGGGSGMGGGVLGRMKSDYLSGVDSDIAAYENPGGAVGKLIGDTQTKEIDALKSARECLGFVLLGMEEDKAKPQPLLL